MLNRSFSPWPSFTEEEMNAVCRVLLSNRVNYWTGEEGKLFEQEFAAWVGTEYAVALANGTVALEAALRAGGVGRGDEVVVTSRTFLASVSSIVLVGAVPIFADVERDSQNISVAAIRAVLTSKTRAIVCVHLAGWPCDMDAIMALAEEKGLLVIEDCAQAHGARYKGRSVGCIGHVGAWSFCQDKIMTTGGEGGMVTTNDHELWRRIWSYKDHGKSWEAVHEQGLSSGFRWLHENFGTNWRMTEMQAVIGRIQLKRMPDWQATRRRNAKMILTAARKCPALRVPEVPRYSEHAWYKCYIFVNSERLAPGWNRDRIMGEINRRGVPCMSGACPEVYLEKAFDNTGWRPPERLPIACELGGTSLMFLVHPTLTDVEISLTCHVMQHVMAEATISETITSR